MALRAVLLVATHTSLNIDDTLLSINSSPPQNGHFSSFTSFIKIPPLKFRMFLSFYVLKISLLFELSEN